MLSYAHGACADPLLGETIGHNLARTIARVPDADALVDCGHGVRYTYAEFGEAVDRLAGGMLAAGLRKGDRVGVWSPNRAEWTLTQYATARAGVILVNINPAYRVSELQYALRQSGCRWIIASQRLKDSDFVEMVDHVRPELPALERAIFFDTPDWEELASGSGYTGDLDAHGNELDFDDPINIQYTSGTTGFPKGATLTHHNILNNGHFVGAMLGYTERDRVCIPVPLYHCFGMVLGNLACDLARRVHGLSGRDVRAGGDARGLRPGALHEPVRRADDVHRRARPRALRRVRPRVAAHRDHGRVAVPDRGDEARQLGDGDRRDEHRVRDDRDLAGHDPGAPRRHAREPLRHRRRGRAPRRDQDRRSRGRRGRTVERGEPGEFLARGYVVMRGYWNDPERTAESIDEQRWMHTGDLATMDEQGYVRIVGRIKDMVIRGGENVYPREIEEFLYTHPEIADVQVIGVPDERYGEELMAWVIPRAGATLTEDEIRDFCKGQIAHYKIPRYVKLVDSFPMTVTGKVQKFKMRETAIEELGLGEAAAIATA